MPRLIVGIRHSKVHERAGMTAEEMARCAQRSGRLRVADRVPVTSPSPTAQALLDLLYNEDEDATFTAPQVLKAITAIEEAARTEGRREAVRAVAGDIEMLRAAGGRADGWVHISEVALRGIFDGVAGLNASESPPDHDCLME